MENGSVIVDIPLKGGDFQWQLPEASIRCGDFDRKCPRKMGDD